MYRSKLLYLILKIWEIGSSPQRARPNILDGTACRALALSPDGRLLAIGTDDHTIVFFDLIKDNVVRTLSGHSDRITSVAFSPDGNVLLSGSLDCTIRLWDISHLASGGVTR